MIFTVEETSLIQAMDHRNRRMAVIDTAKITFTITNTGKLKGDEIAQLYIGCEGSAVDRPVKVLRDFQRVSLEAGETKTVELHVSKKSMAYWDEGKDDFATEDIKYVAYVGNCSRGENLQKVEFTF